MSKTNTKNHFSGLPDIELIVGLVNQVYKLQDDEELKKVLKLRLLSIYHQGFEKPGTTAWESLADLHQYVLKHDLIDADSNVSNLFIDSIELMKNDEIKKVEKSINRKIETNSAKTESNTNLTQETEDETTSSSESDDLSKVERARLWVGKVFGPRDQQPYNQSTEKEVA